MSERPDPTMAAPEGFHWEPSIAHDGWRVLPPGKEKRCRYSVGPRHTSCKQPAVAELNRGHGGKPRWWAYCGDSQHLFGRWIEDGQVMQWKLVEDDGREVVDRD